ncbi:Crossover junction endodeoxyribonuclease RuvC [Candidatus Portiera aleyrodidarum]|uniref:Crossover junction endodeoxyribonuclease RuvC n=1 Tax=Candidatus Portiera aleyrodidarum TV TaxID=1297582 RepID=A0A8D4BU98_9GAMM|nr:crossover junction endodeoxyribonuclease RuvC [Candidatus Portiera aleyrodidarum]AGI27183.1 crossover junction endodeoxyribonuclease RuvC [Candidatus Portiera aleyrodidarum TV]CEI59165.1 Crossover junction endodeoxyribonuclease RuvC [Candidatus Portiera aleyrodidarum]
MIYLGIDPGLLKTGFGLIKIKDYPYYMDSGYINVIKINNFSKKLKFLYSGISEILAHYCPYEVAIEEVFISNKKNIFKTLRLIQARGTAIVCAANHNLPVFEYSSRLIKQCITGYGASNKLILKQIVCSFFKLRYINSYDAIDAIAIALTHYYKYKNTTI